MTPSEVHEVLQGLTQKQLIVPVEGDALKLTADGMVAVRQVTRRDEKNFWVVGQGESFASSGLDDALDSWIEKHN
ncbi:MAG TPA: hypothetical protein VKY85_04590 [Candidatus Angelobacter sp.]|nr:hypothetical protein [Candidatus Angelobacter sp.]